MRIAYIVPSLNNQAPIVVAATLAELMAAQGHSVTIYYFDQNPIRKISSKIVVEKISFLKQIHWASFDIVHSHMIRADLYSFIYKPMFGNTKLITTAHNYIFPELKNYYNAFISIIFGALWNIFWTRMDRICVLTDHAKSYYLRISFNKNISVCYNGRTIEVDKSKIPSELREACTSLKDRNKVIVGSYCNLIKRKRIDRLIRMIHDVKDAGLIVIGDGPERESLVELASMLKVQDRVLFLGYQTDAHLYNEFFDVFAMPSEDEGFGLSLIEAALHKKNIICSDIPVFREIFDESSVSYFGSSNLSLMQAFNSAISSPRKALAANRIALEKFSDVAMFNNYISVYQQVVDAN